MPGVPASGAAVALNPKDDPRYTTCAKCADVVARDEVDRDGVCTLCRPWWFRVWLAALRVIGLDADGQ